MIKEENNFCYPIRIGHEHYESEFDHVHHARIVRLLEEGRYAYLLSKKEPFTKWIEQGLALVVTMLNVRYHREVRAGDIEVWCHDLSVIKRGKTLKICQRIINCNARRRLAVEAELECVFMCIKQRRSVELPKEFLLGIGVS
jgi:acyl-CoA thioesterase FadM